MAENDDSGAAKRALFNFMEARGLKAGPLAKRAGFSASIFYNLKKGDAKTPSMETLERIAEAEGVTVADIFAYAKEPQKIDVRFAVISGGRVTASATNLSVVRPAEVEPAADIDVALISSDGLHPIPASWLVFFAQAPSDPAEVGGTLCVVRLLDQQDAVIGTVSPGASPYFDFQPWHGPTVKNQRLISVQRVLAIQPPA